MKDAGVLTKSLEQLNMSFSEQQINQFMIYYDLLIQWNEVMNLTGITEFNEVVQKHFVDSLSLMNYYDLKRPLRILDLGTGAGFPGIPLKIAFPELNIVLLDSLNKRIKFLNEVIQQLQLDGIQAIHGRAEEYGRNSDYRENFDLCVSRAVANLSSLAEYCIPYVKIGGYFIPYKSGKIQEELESSQNAIKKLGAKIKSVETFTLPNSEIERSFVIIEKCKNTPKAYPRNAGKPTKEPLT